MSHQYDLSQQVKAFFSKMSPYLRPEVQELESGDIVISNIWEMSTEKSRSLNITWKFICKSSGIVTCVVLNTKVSEYAYPQVIEQIAEINRQGGLGCWCFELDYQTGQVAARALMHCTLDIPATGMIGTMIQTSCKMFEAFGDQLIDAMRSGWDADIEAALAGDAEALQRVSDGIKSDPYHYYDSCLRSKARSGVERARDLLNQINGVEPEAPSSSPSQSNSSGGTGCYIATCVYGSYDCPQVWTLRRFRDQALARNAMGKAFIRLYYAVSPHIVRIFGRYEPVRALWQHLLDKLVKCLNDKGYDSTSYHD